MWFLWLSSSLWQIFHPPCLSFKLWVKFLWFCVLPVVSSAAVNVGMHVSFWNMVFSGYTPSLGMSDAIFNLKFYYYFFGGCRYCLPFWLFGVIFVVVLSFFLYNKWGCWASCPVSEFVFFFPERAWGKFTCWSWLLESRLCLEFISAISAPGPFLRGAVLSTP